MVVGFFKMCKLVLECLLTLTGRTYDARTIQNRQRMCRIVYDTSLFICKIYVPAVFKACLF